MTNKDIFLKDGVSVEELIKQLYEIQDFNYNTNMINCKKFFEEQVKPTLTEDERVILKNINSVNYQFIGRNEIYYNLYLAYWEKGKKKIDTARTFDYAFDHLFQFIKERRRIRDKGATK